MRLRPKKILIWLLGLAAAAYLTALAALYVLQRDFLYQPPQDFRTAPAAAGLPEAQEVVLTTQDGEKVIAWYVPPRDGKRVVIFFHGTGDTLALRVPRLKAIIADGTGLVALSFRGYAGSSGQPTEQGLNLDALAAYDFTAARFPPERIVVWGFSLGSGPAVTLASQRPIGRLILEAPYTSTADVAAADMPFIPVRLLMLDQFHSDERIGKIHVPLLVMHGGQDPGINIRFGRRLFALANEPKRFVEFPEGGHETLDNFGASDVAMKFVNE